jgi:hypothetical protein
MINFLLENSEAIFAILGILIGFGGTYIVQSVSDERARKREKDALLFAERKKVYSELIFQLRELYLSSSRFFGVPLPLRKEKINELVHRATFLASSWSLRHRLPVIAALVQMRDMAEGVSDSTLNECLPKDILDMEEEMRSELGITTI